MREDLILCDGCRDRIRADECDPLQMRFILHETMDDGREYHFCGAECLKNFVKNKEFENRFYRFGKKTSKSPEVEWW